MCVCSAVSPCSVASGAATETAACACPGVTKGRVRSFFFPLHVKRRRFRFTFFFFLGENVFFHVEEAAGCGIRGRRRWR